MILDGEVVYSDDGAVGEVLGSHHHGQAGKPDDIRRDGEELTSDERKSRVIPAAEPHDGEILAAGRVTVPQPPSERYSER
jgi:hypothetical protein